MYRSQKVDKPVVGIVLECFCVPEYYLQYVTNITFTGSAMVNWNRGFLIQGVTTVIMVIVCALSPLSG